jgi:hypothetical protein
MRTTVTTLAFVLAIASQGARLGATPHTHPVEQTIVGSWFVTVTPNIMPAFVGLITATADGGLIETNALTLASSLESPGHGRWIHTTYGKYAITFVNLEVNPDGSFAGTGKVRAKLTLAPSGDDISGTFDVDILDPNGVVLFSDSGTVSATRIEVEP